MIDSIKLKSPHTLVIHSQFDEKQVTFTGEFTFENLKQFINENQFPIVMHFDQKTAERIFGENQPTMFLFVDKSNTYDIASKAFKEVATTVRGQIIMSSVTIDSSFGERLAEFLTVGKDDIPTMRIISPSEIEVLKYSFKGDVTVSTIKKFFTDF